MENTTLLYKLTRRFKQPIISTIEDYKDYLQRFDFNNIELIFLKEGKKGSSKYYINRYGTTLEDVLDLPKLETTIIIRKDDKEIDRQRYTYVYRPDLIEGKKLEVREYFKKEKEDIKEKFTYNNIYIKVIDLA